MLSKSTLWLVVAALILGQVWTSPLGEVLSLGLVPDLASHLSSHPSRLQEARLALPSPQDIENIKKVAQILVMIGQQILPAIIGEPQTSMLGEPGLKEQMSDSDENVEKHSTM